MKKRVKTIFFTFPDLYFGIYYLGVLEYKQTEDYNRGLLDLPHVHLTLKMKLSLTLKCVYFHNNEVIIFGTKTFHTPRFRTEP